MFFLKNDIIITIITLTSNTLNLIQIYNWHLFCNNPLLQRLLLIRHSVTRHIHHKENVIAKFNNKITCFSVILLLHKYK